MKWIKTKQKTDKTDWHLWFAWKPVTVNKFEDGNEEKVWMTTILRRMVYDTSGVKIGVGGFWRAEYKEKPIQPSVPDKPTKAPLPDKNAFRSGYLKDIDTGEWKPTSEVNGWDDIKISNNDPLSLASDFMGHDTEDCQHLNGTIKKMDGHICRDCSMIIDDTEWLEDDAIKDIDNPYDYATPKEPKVVMKKIKEPKVVMKKIKEPKVVMKKIKEAKKVVGENTPHEIDTSWEAKRARRNKTIV